MIFTDENIDVPDELLTSLTKGRLVFFIGAGVSARAYPAQPADTYYPLFPELVRQVANRISYALSREEEEDIEKGFADRVLGVMDASSNEIHNCTSAILSEREDTKRSVLHRAIIRLSRTGPNPQIVTTNFDRLLERAMQLEGIEPTDMRVVVAPALPPLRRFSGICYLHGRVDT